MQCTSAHSKPTILLICVVFLTLTFSVQAQNNTGNSQRVAPVIYLDSTKEQDGLIGPVRRVQTETAKLEAKSGGLAEAQRQLIEVTTYNLKGERVDNASYPVAGTAGKEEYKHDDKGNIIEMTLRSADGSIISKEVYNYELDAVGNWVKMTTSLVLFEDGKLRYEPVEATYRSIAYFYDEKIAKLLDSKTPTTTSTVPRSIKPDSASASKSISTQPSEPASSPAPTKGKSTDVTKRLAAENSTDSPEGSKAESRAGSLNSRPNQMEVSLGVREGSPNNSPAAPEVPARERPSAPNPHKAAFDFYKSGREQFNLGNLTGAIEAYKQAIELEPGFADVYLSLGHAYLRLKKPQDAIKAFKESIRIKPEMEEAHYGLGLEYFRAGNMKDASQAFKKAVRVRPNMAKAHYGLALTYQEMGKQDLLLEEYRILQTLDAGLAKKLSDSFPEFNLPCAGRRCD